MTQSDIDATPTPGRAIVDDLHARMHEDRKVVEQAAATLSAAIIELRMTIARLDERMIVNGENYGTNTSTIDQRIDARFRRNTRIALPIGSMIVGAVAAITALLVS